MGEYKLIANLPYYAANPILINFLKRNNKPKLLVVMLQKEVALQITAAIGQMRMLSVIVQFYGKPSIVTHINPKSFKPVPKVHSSLIAIKPYDKPVLKVDSETDSFKLVKLGFSTPRKRLVNSIHHGLNIPKSISLELLDKSKIDASKRPQELSIIEWGNLYKTYNELNSSENIKLNLQLKKKLVKALFINTKNANTFTGKQGFESIKELSKYLSKELTLRASRAEGGTNDVVKPNQILFAST